MPVRLAALRCIMRNRMRKSLWEANKNDLRVLRTMSTSAIAVRLIEYRFKQFKKRVLWSFSGAWYPSQLLKFYIAVWLDVQIELYTQSHKQPRAMQRWKAVKLPAASTGSHSSGTFASVFFNLSVDLEIFTGTLVKSPLYIPFAIRLLIAAASKPQTPWLRS